LIVSDELLHQVTSGLLVPLG